MATSAPSEAIVYVIDDDESARQSLEFLLDVSGIRVRSFASADAFLASSPRMAGACLVTDVRMPGTGGINVQAFGAAEIMTMLKDQIGIPLRATIDMDLQPLHDLMRLFVTPEEQAYCEHLIIIDDETAELLKDVMSKTIARLRPERQTPAHNVGLTSRSVATAKLAGEVPSDLALLELEARLMRATGAEAVILEDADSAAYGAAINQLISGRSHGRSPTLD